MIRVAEGSLGPGARFRRSAQRGRRCAVGLAIAVLGGAIYLCAAHGRFPKERSMRPVRVLFASALLSIEPGCSPVTSAEGVSGHSILFVGNSPTYTNDLPAMVESVAEAAGDSVRRDGGRTEHGSHRPYRRCHGGLGADT